MRKFLISLDKDVQRRELFFAQPDSAGFEVFSAINTMQQEWSQLAQQFDLAKFEQHYGRKVTKGEIGCTLSHLNIYQKIVDDEQISENDYALVCEDDALFNEKFQQNLTALLQQNCQLDLLLIGQSKILDFDDVELEINYPTTFSLLCHSVPNSIFKYAYPYKSYFAGTVAYLIKKSAARKLLQAVQHSHLPFWLADDFLLFEMQFAVQNNVVRPLMVIENPNLISNLEAVRGSQSNNLFKKLIKYPAKKWLAIKKNLSK